MSRIHGKNLWKDSEILPVVKRGMMPTPQMVGGNLLSMVYGGDSRRMRALDNKIRYYLGGVPIIGPSVQWYDSGRKMSDYMKNRGLSWSDMQYPSLGGSGSAVPGALLSASKSFETNPTSIDRLYVPSDEWNEYDRAKFKKW